MRRKIIDDDGFQYLNDLFGIRYIFNDPSRMLQLLYGRYVLRYKSFLIIFSL